MQTGTALFFGLTLIALAILYNTTKKATRLLSSISSKKLRALAPPLRALRVKKIA
jgi:hypothetical protein